MNSFKEYKTLLAEFVRFKSISTDPKFAPEITKTVAWLKDILEKSKSQMKILKGKTTNPVIFANYQLDKKAKTVLIYGHYDVQPANVSDGWKGDPFTLIESEKKLIARGVIDNKGQILAHVFTAIQLIKEGKLKYNIKFLIEGNEETGNVDLPDIMAKNKELLKCDVVMISDGELTNNKPTIEVSLRGGFNCTLTYQTSKMNLHSGLWGGAVPSATFELSRFLSKLYNADNTISFAGIYKGADQITKAQIANNKNLVKTGSDIAKLANVKKLLTEPGTDFYTQTGLRPTMQISGIKGGYTDTGYSNIIPFKVEARINVRLVASQKAREIAKAFEIFVKKNTPSYVDFSLSFEGLHDPIKVNTNNAYIGSVEKILTKVYKTKVNRRNVGGAIPFVTDVKNILGVDTLLIPLVNEDCNMHGTNENFDIELAKKALKFSQIFLSK